MWDILLNKSRININLAPNAIQSFLVLLQFVPRYLVVDSFCLERTTCAPSTPFVHTRTSFTYPTLRPACPSMLPDRTTVTMLYMRPLYTQAIIDIIRHYRWTRIFYVFDNEDGKCHNRQRGTIFYPVHSIGRVHIWYMNPPGTTPPRLPWIKWPPICKRRIKCIFVDEK